MRTLTAKTRQLAVIGALAITALSCGGTSATTTADQPAGVDAAATAPVVIAETVEPLATETPASPDGVEPAAQEPELLTSDPQPADDVASPTAGAATSVPTTPVPATPVPATPVPATPAPPTSIPAPTATAEPVAPVILVPELTGQFGTINGGQIDLGALQGQDVVLWFWAPW